MNVPLGKVLEIVGSQQALASAINHLVDPDGANKVKQAHVWKWLNKTKQGVGADYVLAVAKVVNYQVTPHELRPDLYPHPEDGLPEERRTKPRFAA